MVNWLSEMIGMILPTSTPCTDAAPQAQPVRMIPGGPNAPELAMLAVEWDGIEAAAETERTSRVRDLRLVQLKADGINAVYVQGMVVGGRDGAPLDCALHCQPGLVALEKAYGEPMVFFGEYVAVEGFNATLAEHRRREGTGSFYIYDAVPFAAWESGKDYDVAIETRLERLRAMYFKATVGTFVGVLDFWLLDAGETLAKAHEVWALGYEGLIRKRLGSPFVRRRSRDWEKIKQRLRAPCSVIDTIHKDGNLHRVIVRGPEPSGSKPITLTGGWSASEAESIDIGMAEGSQGRVVEIDFYLTAGAKRSIRSPRFKGLLA